MATKKKSIAKKGLVIVHIGHGKGKTTAAIGLAVRAAGAGMNVFILQFVKGEWPCHERDFLEYVAALREDAPPRTEGHPPGRMTLKTSGKGFVKILGDKKPFQAHVKAARAAYAEALKAVKSKKYELVVLDEIISAVEVQLLKTSDLVRLIKAKPANVHLVMTGHDIPKAVLKLADLVSEIKMIKHPYYQGVLAQRGIDY